MKPDELILYRSDDGRAQVHLRADGDTVWLTQPDIAELFEMSKQNVSLHVRNILKEDELLSAASVIKESLTTAGDGKSYRVKWCNLPMILAVGYRVRLQDVFMSRINPLKYCIRHGIAQPPLPGQVQPIRSGASI